MAIAAHHAVTGQPQTDSGSPHYPTHQSGVVGVAGQAGYASIGEYTPCGDGRHYLVHIIGKLPGIYLHFGRMDYGLPLCWGCLCLTVCRYTTLSGQMNTNR